MTRRPSAALLFGFVQGGPKMTQIVFVRSLELRQIYTKFDSFWHTDSQDDRIM